ncbi:MAG: phosphatidate cytidylyltransferase, partial [Acidimicrobiaceae bacterium]|nr:phosphatidate cytidylyltransferase [Acidimicrobiaceae bacterium]
ETEPEPAADVQPPPAQPVAAARDPEPVAGGEPPGSEGPATAEEPAPPPIWEDPAARPWVTSAPPRLDWGPSGPDDTQAGQPAAPTEPVTSREPESPERPSPPAEEATGMMRGEMPHWTEPPTGEVPGTLGGGPTMEDENMAAWRALGNRGVRWRDEADDWDDVPLDDLADEETRVGALDTTRSEHSDLFSFDEDFSRLEEERSGGHPVIEDTEEHDDAPSVPDPEIAAVGSSRERAASNPRMRGAGGRFGRESSSGLTTRILVGVGLLALLFVAWAIGPKALVVFAAAIVVAASAEAYGMLQRSGFRPATLLALVVAGGTVFGAYWKGIEALPLACVLLFAGSMLWYLLGIVEARPLANVAVTTMTFLWVGLLGSFAALLLRQPNGGGLFIGPVFCAVAADVAAFGVGGRLGSRSLAPNVSPSKTVEGVLAGLVAAIIVGAIVGKELTPWGGIRHGLLLGLVVGIVAPVGDLFESMVKRDLNLKDSGTALLGHGGLLDRFDSILVVLPAAYYLAFWLHL